MSNIDLLCSVGKSDLAFGNTNPKRRNMYFQQEPYQEVPLFCTISIFFFKSGDIHISRKNTQKILLCHITLMSRHQPYFHCLPSIVDISFRTCAKSSDGVSNYLFQVLFSSVSRTQFYSSTTCDFTSSQFVHKYSCTHCTMIHCSNNTHDWCSKPFNIIVAQ